MFVLDHRKQDTVYIGLHLPRQQRQQQHRRHRHHRHKKSKDDGIHDPIGRYKLFKVAGLFFTIKLSFHGQVGITGCLFFRKDR